MPREGEGPDAVRIRKLLKLIDDYDGADMLRAGPYLSGKGLSASGAIYRGPRSTYEDLYFLCEEMVLWSIGLPDNCLTTSFMEAIVQRAGSLLTGMTLEEKLWDLGRLCRPACELIASIATAALQRPYLTGFALIEELATASEVSELTIVTLNHDRLVEQFLVDRDIKFVDGFGEPDGDVRWGEDRVFDEPHRVRLLKLHGSINWYAFHRDGQSQTGALVVEDIADARDGAGHLLRADRQMASFITGLNKPAYYNRGIYADLHFRFSQVLRQCERMLMSGYSWGDDAINFQLEGWLDRTRANRLLLLHEGSDSLRMGSSVLATSRDGWIRAGQFVGVERWLCDTRLADIRDLLWDPPGSKATTAA